MRTKFTLFLLFLNVALFGYLFYFERDWGGAGVDPDARHLLAGQVSRLQWLEVEAPSGAVVRLERNGEAWQITKPFVWPANTYAVGRILGDLQFLKPEATFPVADLQRNGQSLADYGLDHPSVILRMGTSTDGNDEKPIELRLGDTTRAGERLYLLSADGTQVHVVPHKLADSISIPPEALLAPEIFTIQPFEIGSVGLQPPAPSTLRVRLRHDGDLWSLETPIIARASRAGTELFLKRLTTLRAASILTAPGIDPESLGLGTKARRITLEGNNRREILLIGDQVPANVRAGEGAPATSPSGEPQHRYYARLDNRPTLFVTDIPDDLVLTLDTAQEALRDRHVLPIDPSQVTSVLIQAPNQPDLTLQRLEGNGDAQWQLVRRAEGEAPSTRPADAATVTRLLDTLASTEVLQTGAQGEHGFVSDAPSAVETENFGFNQPDRTITLSLAPPATKPNGAPPGPTSYVLELAHGSARDRNVYARRHDQPFVYIVAPTSIAAVPTSAIAYRELTLRTLPAGARITKLQLLDAGTGEVLYDRALAPNETWEQAVAATPEERRKALLSLITALRTLRAQAIVREDFPPTVPVQGQERPWHYVVHTTVTLPGGEGAQTQDSSLFVADRAGGTLQLAGLAQEQVVFQLDQACIDALQTLTYKGDPGPPAEPPAQPAAKESPQPATAAPPAPPTGTSAPTTQPPTTSP